MIQFIKKELIQIKHYLIPIFVINEIILLVLTLSAFYVNSTYQTLLTFIVILFNILSLFIYSQICKTIQEHAMKQADISLYEKQLQIQKEYELVKENNFIVMQKIYDTIFEQLKSTEFHEYQENEAREYAKKLIEENSSLYQTDFCENKIIDAILYNKSIVAKKEHIDFSTAIYVPNNISIEQIDLISLYTNLLDNAIESSLHLPLQERSISIESRIYNNYLIIQLINHADMTKINDHFETTKDQKDIHGLGLKIINRIVKKYHGTLNIEKESDEIKFEIVLKL